MRRIVALVVVTVFVSACASFTDGNDPKRCAMMFGAAGAAAGGAAGYDYSRNNNDGEAAAIGIGTMLGSAALGYAVCALLREETPTPTPVPTPTPTPTPPPPPAPEPPNPCEGRIVLRGVTFAFDSDEVTGASMATLDVAAEALQECPNVNTSVEGYTDSVGNADYNMGLSQRRAESVSNYLSSHGVSPSRLHPKGFGESQPIADNGTDDGRELNRRVELTPRQ
jgi:OOP family OmpA-OmpF porin